MATESTIINVLTDTFVKFATRENLKKFCNDNVIDFNDSSFTKDRIFSLPVLLGLILYPKAHTLFIDEMAYLEGIGSSIASAAAFAKRRSLIPKEYVEEYQRMLVSNIYSTGLAPERWNGHVLLACDGSTYSMPNTQKMRKYFLDGRKTGRSEQPLARGVVVKDVVNDIVVGADMDCYGDDEIKLAIRQMKKLPKVVSELSPVVIFDRKYCAYTLIEPLMKLHIDFIIRVKAGFNKDVDRFIQSGLMEQIVTLTSGSTTRKKLKHMYGNAANDYTVRLIRCAHDVVVMTSLVDDRTTMDDALPGSETAPAGIPVKDVYRLRWTDETTINFLKNNLEIEIFSSSRVPIIYQDFYSKLINYNIVTLIAKAAAEKRLPRKKSPVHRLGINRNDTLGIVAIKFWKSLVLNKLKDEWPEMLRQIGRNTCPIIPDRHNARVFRNIKASGKYVTLTNYRQAL